MIPRDSHLIILLGAIMVFIGVFSILVIFEDVVEVHNDKNVLYLGLVIFICAMTWRVYQSSRELQEMEAMEVISPVTPGKKTGNGTDGKRPTTTHTTTSQLINNGAPTTCPTDSCEMPPKPTKNPQDKAEVHEVKDPNEPTKIPEVELRGMSVNQLLDVVDIIKKRCNAEAWERTKPEKKGQRLQPHDVNLYDLNHYLITPFTKRKKCSYVEIVADGPQKPDWFVSHWWGEPVIDFVNCVRQHAIDHGYSFDKHYYWICAYANNQHSLDESNLDTPEESSFAEAIRISEKKVLSIMDQEAETFSRIWCCLEVSMGLGGTYEIYTAHTDPKTKERIMAYDVEFCKDLVAKRERGLSMSQLWIKFEKELKKSLRSNLAVGVTQGICKIDGDDIMRFPQMKQFRESHFPLKRIKKVMMEMDVEKSDATEESDKVKILKHIKKNYEGDYKKFNNKVKGTIVASLWRALLIEKNKIFMLEKNKKNNDKRMQEYATVLKVSGIENICMSMFDCKQFNDDALRMLADHLPLTLKTIRLEAGGEECGLERGTYLLKKLLDDKSEEKKRNLQEVVLPRCQLKCEFPANIVNLTNLTTLRLEGNGLTGKMPDDIGKCKNLVDFWVFLNPKFSGGVPKSIGEMKELKRFHIGHSDHNGEIPKEFGECTKLESSYMGNNRFTGVLPRMGKMTKLRVIFLNDNEFSGEIPPEIGNCKSLDALFLHNNFLEGPLPRDLRNCKKLRTLTLYGNDKLDASSFYDVLKDCELTTLYIDTDQAKILKKDYFGFVATTVRVIKKEDLKDKEFNEKIGVDMSYVHLPDLFNDF